MQIIITLKKKQNEMDFQLNSEMKIKNALMIIQKNSGFKISDIKNIFSERRQRMYSSEYSFDEAGIHTGDCLKLDNN